MCGECVAPHFSHSDYLQEYKFDPKTAVAPDKPKFQLISAEKAFTDKLKRKGPTPRLMEPNTPQEMFGMESAT